MAKKSNRMTEVQRDLVYRLVFLTLMFGALVVYSLAV